MCEKSVIQFNMRIDKFLKVSRLVKRREVAKQLCLNSDITINGKAVKPMAEVSYGDIVVLILGKHKLTAKINDIREFANKEQAANMIEIISDEVKD